MTQDIHPQQVSPEPEDDSGGYTESFFAPNIDPDDITPFWALRQKLPLLNAFITLFRGTETDILLRLLVLSEMLSRLQHPSWGMAELRHAFGYLTDTALETTLKRLREGGLISYDREQNTYSVTPLGQKAQSALNLFLKTDEDEGIGMLTGVVYASEVAGTLGREELQHLLYRLNQLEQEMIGAMESMSEHRILRARQRFETIWHYIEKGTEIIKKIAGTGELDRQAHRLAQQIGHAQSRLAKFTSLFQRVLNDIDRQRVHLGNSGVSTSDLNRYLMSLDIDTLVGLLDGALGRTVLPEFVLTDIMADIAEYELIEKERFRPEQWSLPEQVDSPPQADIHEEDFVHLEELQRELTTVQQCCTLHELVPRESYELSAYRLSMLSLVGGSSSEARGHMAGFVSMPFEVEFQQETEEVMNHGVKTMSKGMVRRTGR